MLLLKTSKTNQGFTLIEVLIVLFIFGILSSFAAPSFLAMKERSQVNDALNTVQGALREAQTEAIRKSKNCNITLSATTITSSNGCLITGDRTLPPGVVMAASNGNTINYGIRGNTTFTNPTLTTQTIGVYLSNGAGKQKCLQVSSPLGIIRTGIYDPTTNPVSCNKA